MRHVRNGPAALGPGPLKLSSIAFDDPLYEVGHRENEVENYVTQIGVHLLPRLQGPPLATAGPAASAGC
jgi:hypothetical protein